MRIFMEHFRSGERGNGVHHTIGGEAGYADYLFFNDARGCIHNFGGGHHTLPTYHHVKQQLSAPVPGWSIASEELPHQLAGLTFFDGKPAEKASLVPDKQAGIKGKTVALWTFGVRSRPIWVACRYSSTDIVLTRELPKNIRTCGITYSTTETIAGLPVIEKVDCKDGQ